MADKMRPNIRVEIHNNLVESMEVDKEILSENEEGEILDDTETDINTTTEDWGGSKAVFTTGINIFDKQEQEKLIERAKRFALKPDEINTFSEEDLQQLHYTLGITGENNSVVRFKAVHMLGTDQMTTDDILEYFHKYAPDSIEWIDMDSCNVLWVDKISAARALYHSSRVVKGMPVRAALAKKFDLLEDESDDLMINSNREIALDEDDDFMGKIDYKNAVDIEEITISVPPGFWRLGTRHPKSKCILLRFAFKTDRQAFRTEKFSKYIVPKPHSKRNKVPKKGIFERNKELKDDKNPWGILARNWDEDANFREKVPVIDIEDDVSAPKMEIKNPNILKRLGKKSVVEEVVEKSVEISSEGEEVEEEDKSSVKSKIPRMRMYADEEEEKQKRKKLIQTLKKQTEKLDEDRSDLRNVLGVTNKRTIMDRLEEETAHDDRQEDLGLRLKNRSKSMILALNRHMDEIENYMMEREDSRPDARTLIGRRRAESPRRRSRSPVHRQRSPLVVRRRRSPITFARRRRSRSKSPERQGLYSYRRIKEERDREVRRHRRNYSPDEEEENFGHKPKSKVAVVIKTQKKPAVASTIWSRVKKPNESESESSESEEESSSTSSSSGSESSDSEEIRVNPRTVDPRERPGFNSGKDVKSRLSAKVDHRSPLKIEITND
ncbi:unnamed protein product [Brassicogethes aeneus]|uniref:Nuclear cap-binding protein subunit 3 n=1 Tax=Brassicogethes aeneus TaxID=1431903 RepID=A0A9P0FHW5_BRAAE|nr:unnamed protein product [Brassicogethes aeneus]